MATQGTETQSARWKNANRSDGSDSLFLSPSRLHSLARCFCSCLSLFSPIQLLHGLNPEPSSLLLSIHPRSVSAESLPGVALAQSCRRERERRLWKEEKEERGKKEREAERNSETGKKEEMDTKKKREVSDTPVDLRRRFVLFILHRSFFCREQKD